MVFWDDLGFATNYRVDPEIEYPGDGQWKLPVVATAQSSVLPTPGPLAAIHPGQAESWVLASGFTEFGALYGTPDPDALCVLDRFDRVTLIDTREPSGQTQLDVWSPVAVAGVVDQGLLLVVGSHGTVTAFAANGVERWSNDLGLEDVHIVRTDNGRVQCRGLTRPMLATPVRIVMDASTGRLTMA